MSEKDGRGGEKNWQREYSGREGKRITKGQEGNKKKKWKQ